MNGRIGVVKDSMLNIMIVLFLILSVSGCVNEPPRREYPTPQSGDTQQGLAPPAFEISPTMQDIWDRGYLKYGLPISAPYSGVVGFNREFQGLIPDIAIEIADRLGGFPSLTAIQRWNAMPADLENEIVHMIIGGPVTRAEFDDFIFFKIGERGHCILVDEADSHLQDVDDFETTGAAIAVITGTDAENILSLDHPKVHIISKGATPAEASVDSLLDGEADGAIVFADIVPLILDNNPGLKAIPENCITEPILVVPWGISMQPDDAAFNEYIAMLIDQLFQSGWLQDRMSYWSNLENSRVFSEK